MKKATTPQTRWAKRNPVRVREYVNKWAADRRELMREIVNLVKSQPCTDCGGVFHPCVMQFDHIHSDKKYVISHMVRGKVKSIDALIDEMCKCELVCANCHAMRTYKRQFNCGPEEFE